MIAHNKSAAFKNKKIGNYSKDHFCTIAISREQNVQQISDVL